MKGKIQVGIGAAGVILTKSPEGAVVIAEGLGNLGKAKVERKIAAKIRPEQKAA